MNSILFSETFGKSFSKINSKESKQQIWKKILELERRAPLGKKLKGNPYWSIRIGRFRVIYELRGSTIKIADILERKHGYKEL